MSTADRDAHRILVAALDLEGPERQAFVDRECGDDDQLRQIVDRLLQAVGDSTDFLESPALENAAAVSQKNRSLPKSIAGLKIVRQIGRGGMATVYEASQQSPNRRVAVKVLNAALANTSVLQRFQFEGDVLARLHHPGIASIYGSGTCDDAFGNEVPYFVMEFVPDATPISVHSQQKNLSVRERLLLFEDVCDAVQYGHQMGVIHRDLKPGNILVDGDGRPRIIDFGVAKAVGPGVERLTISQDRGHLIGTMNYMSPEQCSGDGQVDTRTDVYSLGVVLYELLSKTRPYELSSSSILDAVRTVQDQRPRRVRDRAPGISDELDAIVMKALEKEPARRYATASEFAADVRRYLEDRPVLARPPSSAYQLRMFAKRNRALVAALAVAVIALITGIVATTRMAVIAAEARDAAQENQRVLEQVAEFQESQLGDINVAAMGEGLRASLLKSVRNGLEQGGEFPSGDESHDIESQFAQFNQLASDVNFTTLALDAINEAIWEPSQSAIDQQFQDKPIVRARLLQALVNTMNRLGRPEPSVPLLEEVVRIRREVLGNEHPDTLGSLQRMGILLGSLGRWDEGIAYLREVVETRTRLLGRDDPKTLSAANGLGGALRRAGDHEAAQRIWEETLDARRRVLGNDHPETLNSLNNIGVVHAIRGDLDQAEAAWRELLERRRRLLGPNHPEYRGSLSNLGLLFLVQGNLTEAQTLLEQSLKSLRAELGDDHPSTLSTMANVAELRMELGDIAAAEKLYRENYTSRARTLGDEDPRTLRALADLAGCVFAADHVTEAEQKYREAIAAQRRLLGNEHPDTIEAISAFATMLHACHNFEEAETLHQEAVNSARAAFGDEHQLTGECLGGYGRMLVVAERLDEAKSKLLSAYEVLLAAGGPQPMATRRIAEELIAIYEAESPKSSKIENWRRAARGERMSLEDSR